MGTSKTVSKWFSIFFVCSERFHQVNWENAVVALWKPFKSSSLKARDVQETFLTVSWQLAQLSPLNALTASFWVIKRWSKFLLDLFGTSVWERKEKDISLHLHDPRIKPSKRVDKWNVSEWKARRAQPGELNSHTVGAEAILKDWK